MCHEEILSPSEDHHQVHQEEAQRGKTGPDVAVVMLTDDQQKKNTEKVNTGIGRTYNRYYRVLKLRGRVRWSSRLGSVQKMTTGWATAGETGSTKSLE